MSVVVCGWKSKYIQDICIINYSIVWFCSLYECYGLSFMHFYCVFCFCLKAIDCMYFNGLNAKGDYFLLRIARRQNREAEIWLYINVKDIGFFQSPVHPDTTLYNANPDSFDAGGLRFECVEPMRKWKVTFNGMLRSLFLCSLCSFEIFSVQLRC